MKCRRKVVPHRAVVRKDKQTTKIRAMGHP